MAFVDAFVLIDRYCSYSLLIDTCCAYNREEAEQRFQEISRAYESLMTTDEDKRIEQLGFG